MRISSFGRLVTLYQQRLIHLFRGSLLELLAEPDAMYDHEFQERVREISRQMAAEVAHVNASSWRAAAAKSSNARKVYEALRHELESTGLGYTLNVIAREQAALISSLPQFVARKINAEAMRAVQEGRRPAEIAEMIRAMAPRLTKSRIELISRTSVGIAESEITKHRAQQLGIEYVQWLTSEDQRVRPSHKNLDKVVMRFDDPPQPEALIGEHSTLGKGLPGQFPNCFPGDTRIVSPSGVKTLWRAAYSGDIVEIEFDGGGKVSPTPNHPVLTKNGWRIASALDIGDDLVHLVRSGDGSPFQPNMDDDIPTFEQVFESYSNSANRMRCGLSLDFHGDVFRNNVDQIAVADDLHFDRKSGLAHRLSDFNFTNSDSWICQVIAGVALQIASSCLTSAMNEIFSFGGGHALHTELVGFGRAAWLNANEDQIFAYGSPLNSEMSSYSLLAPLLRQIQILQGVRGDDVSQALVGEFGSIPSLGQSSGEVPIGTMIAPSKGSCTFSSEKALVRVTKKFIRKFSGHVYTLESGDGSYAVTPTGIIAQNCRCVSAPVVSLDELKFPIRYYAHGQITRLTRAQFTKIAGIPLAA